MDAERFMNLKELQNIFHTELDSLYDKNEVQSFFKLLVEHHLKLKPIEITLNPNYSISEENLNSFEEALFRLKKEEPIQYVIGETEFFGLTFKVNSKTLIPRPETEELVQWIIDDQKKINHQSLGILDIGTGSGCIAITLAKHLTNAEVFALDISPQALLIAKENATINKVEVSFIEADILSSTTLESFSKSKQFDIIVSNPPYVRELEKTSIKNNVLQHEPHLALFVQNDDALQFYKAICEFAVHNLKAKGSLYFEINQYLGSEMKQLLETYHFESIELKKDLFGNDRMIKAIKP